MILCELIKEIYVRVSARPHPGDPRLLTHLLLRHLFVHHSHLSCENFKWSRVHAQQLNISHEAKAISTLSLLKDQIKSKQLPFLSSTLATGESL